MVDHVLIKETGSSTCFIDTYNQILLFWPVASEVILYDDVFSRQVAGFWDRLWNVLIGISTSEFLERG